MTTLLAPVLGPIFGGGICDNFGWEYIFYINIPIAVVCSITALRLLRPFETKIFVEKIDFVGLILLIAWVSALQLMLDEGKNYDWFDSNYICSLAIVAAIGFTSFIIWELTHEKPIVNLRIFRHRGYTMSVITISLAFSAFFGAVVLTPLWLQMYMGYTASWSGISVAALGFFSMLSAPVVAKLTQKYDLRILVFSGVMWLGLITFARSFNSTDMTFLQIAIPMLIQGFGIPFFFIPLSRLALVSVNPDETASAAGLMSFMRTLAGAVATSIVTTSWEGKTNIFRTDLVARVLSPEQLSSLMGDSSIAGQRIAAQVLDQMTQSQAVMLATNQIFLIVAFTFSFAALAICFAPKPGKPNNSDSTPAH
jgi:DHA2 family multidrug resistance protein